MTLLFSLPDSIHLEILSYIDLRKKCEYTRLNRMVSERLTKKARYLTINNSYLQAKQKYQQKLALIENPSHQLAINAVRAASHPLSLPRKIHSLSIKVYDFVTYVLQKVEYIGRLELIGIYSNRKQLYAMPSHLNQIATAIQLEKLTVNELILSIDPSSIKALPSFSRVSSLLISGYSSLVSEGLTLHQYTRLTSLILKDCSYITDVSSLAHINELHLTFCPNIVDISCLNHNHKIVIGQCPKIQDYSRSFKYSAIIEIGHIFSSKNITPIDLDYLEKVQILKLTRHDVVMDKPLPKTMKSLRLEYHKSLRSLPENNLQKVEILWCTSFESLINMNHIGRVLLEGLDIISLSELHPGFNRVVKVKSCRKLADFHCLSGCKGVEVIDCPLLTDTSVLRNVENLYFEPAASDMEGSKVTILNLEGVTEMELSNVMDLSLLQTATRLKTVKISEDEFVTTLETREVLILRTLFTLPCLQKVILLNSRSHDTNTEISVLLEELDYHRELYEKSIVFLRGSNKTDTAEKMEVDEEEEYILVEG